ncbi:hypothetical protein AK812_SmicGene31076 [Symbiodinium microadriaticum]|uniref:Uncharacterized protein n=1 Tax=Symbiodinium microadriaticum TaxID=2951 RepID=A0A1Q9CXP8_SYMMI|nr:hypothetical protein AK812_SmicGene31076 [Symbiodinium microadriaticum]CAE7870865.1 unnamed protein product [Symbiodinium microadriaticum]
MRFTLVDYRWSRQGELHNLKIRPKAAALVAFLLGQQDLGRCQLGFYTTLSGENAGLVARRLLATAAPSSRFSFQDKVLVERGGHRRIWLFDESFGEPNPAYQHSSKTHMHMKNLELALSASETLGRKFHRASLVHVTCVGVEAGKHVDEASFGNLLFVAAWRGDHRDYELQVVSSYLKHLLIHRPSYVQTHLQAYSLDDFRDMLDWEVIM